MHAAAEVRAVRRDDDEMLPLPRLTIPRDAHRLRPVGRDGDERADEVAQRRANDPGARDDALGHVPVDPDAGGVQEDASVDLADVDAPRSRLREEGGDLLSLARVAEGAREVIARAGR